MAQINYSDEADYSAAREGFILNSPVAPSLIHFFDQGAMEAARNLAMLDASASTVVGDAASMNGFMRFGSQAQHIADKYVQTSISDAPALTALLIVKCPDTFADGDHKPSVFGNYAYGDAFQGITLVFESDVGTVGYAEYQNGAVAETAAVYAYGQKNSQWAALAFVVESGAGLRLFNLTKPGTDSAIDGALPRRLSPRTMRIGSAPVGFAGQLDVAFTAIVPAALSRARCEVALAPVRDYFEEKFGIVT